MNKIKKHDTTLFPPTVLIVVLLCVLTIYAVPVYSTSSQPPSAPDETANNGQRNKEMPDNMVFVKGGCYQMGDIFTEEPSSSKPVHEVCLDDFYAGKYEITIGEFRNFTAETGYKTEAEKQDGCHSWVGDGTEEKIKNHYWSNTGFPQTDNHPVVCISWNDANNYIQWLNKKEGRNYRLLTEAEWEYAARSRGKNYLYSWGTGKPAGNIADESAREVLSGLSIWEGYRDGFSYTAPVGSFIANELGIHDMSGNVYEWVSDWQEKDYYSHSPRENPSGGADRTGKILRGGAWDLQPETARTISRYWNMAGARAVCIGFRIAHPAGQN